MTRTWQWVNIISVNLCKGLDLSDLDLTWVAQTWPESVRHDAADSYSDLSDLVILSTHPDMVLETWTCPCWHWIKVDLMWLFSFLFFLHLLKHFFCSCQSEIYKGIYINIIAPKWPETCETVAGWRQKPSLSVGSLMFSGFSAGSSMFCMCSLLSQVGDYVLFGTYIIQLYTPLNWFGTYYRWDERTVQEAPEPCPMSWFWLF